MRSRQVGETEHSMVEAICEEPSGGRDRTQYGGGNMRGAVRWERQNTVRWRQYVRSRQVGETEHSTVEAICEEPSGGRYRTQYGGGNM